MKGGRGRLAAAAVLCALLAAPGVAEELEADYVIGARDVLEVQVYQQEDLRQQVRVSEEGRISLPLVGEVTAAGLTVGELVETLEKAYSEYIYEPQVSVFIREYHSKEFFLLGEVRRPGAYQLTGKVSLLELISQAGGVTESGGDAVSVIHRASSGEEAGTLVVNLRELLESGGTSGNVELQDGDTVYVPRAKYFFVFGEVTKPGSFKMERGVKITVLKAISLAGGFTEKAAKGKLKITRDRDGDQSTFRVDLDAVVEPNDIVIVPESFF